MKWLSALCWMAGILCIVTGGAQYLNSGESLSSIPLNPEGGTQGYIELTSDMNPVRATLSTRYISRTKQEKANFYRFTFELVTPSERPIVSREQIYSRTRDSDKIQANETSAIKRQNNVVSRFDIEENGEYLWTVSLKNMQSEIQSAQLIFKRNVAKEVPNIVWIGALLFVLGIIASLFNRTKKGR